MISIVQREMCVFLWRTNDNAPKNRLKLEFLINKSAKQRSIAMEDKSL